MGNKLSAPSREKLKAEIQQILGELKKATEAYKNYTRLLTYAKNYMSEEDVQRKVLNLKEEAQTALGEEDDGMRGLSVVITFDTIMVTLTEMEAAIFDLKVRLQMLKDRERGMDEAQVTKVVKPAVVETAVAKPMVVVSINW